MSRQRSGTALPKGNKKINFDETRRRSGVITNLDLGFDPSGINFGIDESEEFEEHSIYGNITTGGESDQEIDSALVDRKAHVAEHIFKHFGRKREKTFSSRFSEAAIEISDSDYSFTSDNEDEVTDIELGVANKIINKKIEEKLNYLMEDEDAYKFFLKSKEFTKEFLVEKKLMKKSSGKLAINLDVLDCIPEDKLVDQEELSVVKPEGLWKILVSQFGQPSSYNVNLDASEFAFGFKNSKIVIFQANNQTFKEINYSKIQSCVSFLEFYDQKRVLVAGYENGDVVLYQDAKQGKVKGYKKVMKYLETGGSEIVQVMLINDMEGMIIVDRDCSLIFGEKTGKKEFDKFKFDKILEGQFESVPSIDLFEFYRRNVLIFSCGSTASIFILKKRKNDPFVKIAQIGAPVGQKKSAESFPILATVNYNKSKISILCLVWGYNISLYIIKPAKNGEVEIDFKDNLEFDERVVYASQFSSKKICFVTTSGQISLYSVQDHIESKKRKEEKDEKRRRGTMTFNLVKLKMMEKIQEGNIPAPPSASTIPAPMNELGLDSKKAKTMEINLPQYLSKKRKVSDFSQNTDSTLDDSTTKIVENLEEEDCRNSFIRKTGKKLEIQNLKEYFRKGEDSLEKVPISKVMKTKNSQMFILTQGNLVKFEFKNWIKFINECIQNGSNMLALKSLNEILDEKDLNLREIGNNNVEFMNDFSPLLLLVITKVFPSLEKNHKNVNLMTNLSMFTLLKAGLSDYIATHLQVIMEAFGFKSQYFHNLRLFFEGGLIPIIEEGKISQIIESMNDHPLKKKQFLNFLFQRRPAFRGLAMTYAENSQDTFYIYSSFCTSLGVSNTGKPLQKLLNDLKLVKSEEDSEKSRKIIAKMIWYVYEIGLRSEKKYGQLDETNQSYYVFKTFLKKDLLKEIINADTVYFLECFKFLLLKNLANQFSRHTKPLITLEQSEDKEVNFQLEENPNEIESKTQTSSSLNRKAIKILDSEKSDKSIAFVFEKLNEFVDESNHFKFDFFLSELCLKSIDKVFISDEYIKKIFTAVVDQFHEITSDAQVDMQEDDIVMLLFSIYTYNRQLFEGDSKIFNSLKEKSKKLMLIQYEMKKNQKATFALFQRLVTDNDRYKYELFNWLENGLKRPEDKQRMLNVIDEEYIYLIKICHKMYAKLLQTLTIEEQMDYIMKYKPPTKSKLEIFKKILNFVKKKHMENEITNEFKVEYINLLNQHEKSKVLPELMTGKYPSSDCLQTCIDFKNHLAIAYIKERLGYYSEALDIYKHRLKKVLKSLTRGGRYFVRQKKIRMLGRLKKESQMALNLCMDAENPEKFLFEYLEFVVDTTAKYKKWKIKEWISMSENLLDYILSSVPAKHFIKKIEDPKYPFVQDEYLMERTVNHFKELKGIFNATKKVNASDWWDSNNQLIVRVEPGKRTQVIDDPDAVGDCAMLFRNCDHVYECSQSEIHGQPIYCSDCEEIYESEIAYNRLIRLWKREKNIFKPRNLVRTKKHDLNLFFKAFSSLNLLEMGKYKVNFDKWDREKKRINDFENYMSSEAAFSEIDSGTSMIE